MLKIRNSKQTAVVVHERGAPARIQYSRNNKLWSYKSKRIRTRGDEDGCGDEELTWIVFVSTHDSTDAESESL